VVLLLVLLAGAGAAGDGDSIIIPCDSPQAEIILLMANSQSAISSRNNVNFPTVQSQLIFGPRSCSAPAGG
jgi:hypothetical protein